MNYFSLSTRPVYVTRVKVNRYRSATAGHGREYSIDFEVHFDGLTAARFSGSFGSENEAQLFVDTVTERWESWMLAKRSAHVSFDRIQRDLAPIFGQDIRISAYVGGGFGGMLPVMGINIYIPR
ncbi:hypothetical protein HC928_12665 [bacterium]|nr:hypothetical protein [bacterium]